MNVRGLVSVLSGRLGTEWRPAHLILLGMGRTTTASTSTELCVPVAPGSPAGLVATMIVALVSTACLAVLVVEEDEPNGQGSHEEGEKSNEAQLD